MNKNIFLLILGFFFIAIGFNGVQQYITSYFSYIGFINVGFNSLILIYLFFVLFTPLASIFISKFGAKKSMIMGSIVYSLFIISLLTKNIFLIYTFSILLGVASSMLWTGHGVYLIRASEKSSFGKNAGSFVSIFFFSSAIGIFILGLLIEKVSFTLPFIIFSILPLFGFLLFFELKDIKSQNVKNRFLLVKKSMKNITALKLSSVWFSQSFVFGLSLGLIPLTIKNVLGSSYISILLPLFYIMPTLFSYFFGKSSDQKGRGKIIYLSYALGISGLISLYLSTKLSLVIGVVLLALSLASIKIITLALPGDISEDHNLDFLTGLFWVIQNIGVLGALILSRFIQSNAAYLISLIIMLLSLGILLSVFKTNFSREKFQEIKLKLSEQIK